MPGSLNMPAVHPPYLTQGMQHLLPLNFATSQDILQVWAPQSYFPSSLPEPGKNYSWQCHPLQTPAILWLTCCSSSPQLKQAPKWSCWIHGIWEEKIVKGWHWGQCLSVARGSRWNLETICHKTQNIPRNRTGGNGQKAMHSKFHWNMKNFFTGTHCPVNTTLCPDL